MYALSYHTIHYYFTSLDHNMIHHDVIPVVENMQRIRTGVDVAQPGYLKLNQRLCQPGMVGLGPEWVRLAPNGIIPRLFHIRFQDDEQTL